MEDPRTPHLQDCAASGISAAAFAQRWADWHVPIARFEQRREPLLRHASYSACSTDKLDAIAMVTTDLANYKPRFRMRATQRRMWNTLDWLSLQYSAGAPVEIFAGIWPQALLWCEEYIRVRAAYQKLHQAAADTDDAFHEPLPPIDLANSDYWTLALRLVCFGLLSGHAAQMPRVMAVLDDPPPEQDTSGNRFTMANLSAHKIRDGLIERLVAPFVSGRGTPPENATRVLPYQNLLPLFTTSPGQHPALMATYLEKWLNTSRYEPYFHQHGEADATFYGYWSWEAAAVTWLLEIDDSSYRDMPHYPRDLVDFARQTPPTPIVSTEPPAAAGSVSTPPTDNNGDEEPAETGHTTRIIRLLLLPPILFVGLASWLVQLISSGTRTWQLLRRLVPGDRQALQRQVNVWFVEGADDRMDMIRNRAGFEVRKGDVPAFITAVNACAERWHLSIDWTGERSDEELLAMSVRELMAVAYEQMQTSGFTLWSRYTGMETHAGWIARTRDDRKIRTLAKRLDIEVRPGNEPF